MKKARSIDAYLATLDDVKRAALEKLRRDIRAAARGAEECIAYGVPTFKLGGRMLVSFGAAAKHCSFYPGAAPIARCKSALKAYSLSKGTVRVPADKPLPTALVRRLVRVRMAERAGR
ncbi:MAG TPA: DUF1801 domain-containing protein [Dongiaceae bacterium]|nr:DUF1801 domain-containing protein [Dongiaceae bacterium]